MEHAQARQLACSWRARNNVYPDALCMTPPQSAWLAKRVAVAFMAVRDTAGRFRFLTSSERVLSSYCTVSYRSSSLEKLHKI
jgi:hypothetical protein